MEHWWQFGVFMITVWAINWWMYQRSGKNHQWLTPVMRTCLIGYLGFVFTITLLGRPVSDYYKAEWMPFWSWYEAIVKKDPFFANEIILNVLMLAPVGGLFAILRKISAKQAFMIGLMISAGIEVLQLVLRRGLFEWDDMLHNAVGCMVGTMIVNWLRKRNGFYSK